MAPRVLLLAALAAPALGATVKSSLLMFYETGPEGSGPMPSSVSLAAHASGPPTATVAQYLNEPIGVLAFSAAAGADAPLWSFYPESVDMDLTWELAGSKAPAAPGGADTVVLQYANELFSREDANCTLTGVSTAASATSYAPVWTAKVPSCGPTYAPQNDDYGQWRSIAITADGATLVASLVSNNAEVLMGWSLATGKALYSVPTAGGSYGVYLSADSKWALVAADDGNGGRTSFVYSTATGAQRGATGCRTPWNVPPALSDDGSVIATGDQNGMRLCAWDEASGAYGAAVAVAIPSRGQTYWFPVVMSVLTVGGSTFAAGSFAGGAYSNVGRFYAVDVGAAMAGGSDYIVLDSLLDNNIAAADVAWALVRKAGPYWILGTTGGTANATSPTEYLFAPGTVDAPSLDAPLWNFTGGGSVNNLDAALVASAAGSTTLQVLAGGPGNIGPDGNGGQVYWHELVITA
jgi:hypothetical protein